MSAALRGADARLFAGFVMVGVVGFATDAGLLAAGLALHLSPFVARAISVLTALQVTFLLNGLLVFRQLSLRLVARQWAVYMLSNGFGAGCNYLIFAALTLSHAPVVSQRVPAFVIAAVLALAVNYTGTRFLAFRRHDG